MYAACEGDRVLPDEGVRVFKRNRLTRCPDCEKAVDNYARGLRKPGWRRHSHVCRVQRLSDDTEPLKTHETEARHVDQARTEGVRVRQHEHVIPVGLIRTPARDVCAEGRERFGEWFARVEIPAGELVIGRKVVIQIRCDLILAIRCRNRKSRASRRYARSRLNYLRSRNGIA